MRTAGNHALHTTDEVIGEIASGQGIGMAALGRKLPGHRSNERVNGATPWRWASKGVRLDDGRHVKLEAAKVGGRVLTTEAAFKRFLVAQATPTDAGQAANPRTPHQRDRAADRAAAELDRMGI